jgi:hypothetical protein
MKKFLIYLSLIQIYGQAVAQECGASLSAAGKQKTVQGTQEIVYVPNVWPIPVGKHFSLNVQVCGSAPALTKVDADMPAHKHGMNYKPVITALAPAGSGMYRIDGLMFHMPGQWRLTFDLAASPATRLSQNLMVD